MKKIKSILLSLVFISKLSAQSIPFKWVSGSDVINQLGVYGTKGVANVSNIPGARNNSVSWVDLSGNLWLFGGQGVSTSTLVGYLNDLWKYDINTGMWAWIAGTSTIQSTGQYGTMGVASSTNYPGARQNAYTWTDNTGNLWLFGGQGYGSTGAFTYLNDLWKYNTTTNQWTWMKGAITGTPSSVFGSLGVSSSSTTPGGRFGGGAWIDNSNNLWLFGGQQFSTVVERTNDLWKYSISLNQWTWVSGSNTANQNGNYGTKGVLAPTNVPGARQASVYWKDNTNNFWLFGGDGLATSGTTNNYLNDLWKYDVNANMWVWISGSNSYTQSAVYGSLGVPSSSNIPGARQMSIGWTDVSGNLWLFGAWGYVGPPFGRINDLWKYDLISNQWAWMGGQNITNQIGIYGTQGVASTTNIPGARRMSVAWKDNAGKFWLLGGNGIDKNNSTGYLNDLWQIDVSSAVGVIENESDKSTVIIYPNPSCNFVSLKVPSGSISNIKIKNYLGQEVMLESLNSNNSTLNIESLPSGVYFIEFNNTQHKFIKE